MEGPSKCPVWARLGGPTEYDPGRFNIERPPLPELALGTAFGHVRKTAIGFNRFDEAQRDRAARAFRDVIVNGEEIRFGGRAEDDRIGHRAERLARLAWCWRRRAKTFSAGRPRGSRL